MAGWGWRKAAWRGSGWVVALLRLSTTYNLWYICCYSLRPRAPRGAPGPRPAFWFLFSRVFLMSHVPCSMFLSKGS
jgi:hypothetical protein